MHVLWPTNRKLNIEVCGRSLCVFTSCAEEWACQAVNETDIVTLRRGCELSHLELKKRITSHTSRGLAPAAPLPDGIRGSRKLLEWHYDRERFEYVASSAEYEEFVVAVKKSVEPALSVDMSDSCGSREILQGAEAQLNIGQVYREAEIRRGL